MNDCKLIDNWGLLEEILQRLLTAKDLHLVLQHQEDLGVLDFREAPKKNTWKAECSFWWNVYLLGLLFLHFSQLYKNLSGITFSTTQNKK